MSARARRWIAAASATVAMLGMTPVRAGAAAPTKISAPSGSPYRIALDAHGEPVPFTVAATGFTAGSLIFVEQCDGRAASEDGWAPTRDCDLGSSPAAAIVDRQGRATFSSSDHNHVFRPFRGPSPQGLFNCLTPNEPSPKNGLPDYRQCQIRVSTNNVLSTADQAFLPIVLGPSNASRSSGSSTRRLIVAAIVVVLAAVGGWLIRTRRPARRR